MRPIRALVLIGACALATSGCTAYGFGRNDFGQLGDGTTNTRLDPVAAARNPNWIKVDAGTAHSCGIDVSLALYCWGDNESGALGLGTSGDFTTVPKRVGTASGWTDVDAAADSHSTCGIRSGSLFCWGANGSGQLGLGDANDRLTPTQVEPGSQWKQVNLSGDHSCGIQSTGALWCWGAGGAGQLGDGLSEDHLVPTRAGETADWLQVSVGFLHTCGIRRTGILFCWGYNYSGQIGDGTWGPTGPVHPAPTQVGMSTRWTSVAAGGSHNCAIRAGALYCWGNNGSGQLGNGTFTDPDDPGGPGVPVPTQVETATDWTDVAAVDNASCAIRANDLLFCWGGALAGDGTGSAHHLPTQAQFDKWATVSLGGEFKVGLRNVS